MRILRVDERPIFPSRILGDGGRVMKRKKKNSRGFTVGGSFPLKGKEQKIYMI